MLKVELTEPFLAEPNKSQPLRPPRGRQDKILTNSKNQTQYASGVFPAGKGKGKGKSSTSTKNKGRGKGEGAPSKGKGKGKTKSKDVGGKKSSISRG